MVKRALLVSVVVILSMAAFPVNRGLVTDDAHVFTQEEASALEAKLRAFEQASSVEFAVVTVTSLDGMSIDEYRVALFKAWGIGKKGKDNGVLMVVAPNEPPRGKVGIEVGYGLEGLLNDAAVGTIIRERIVPGWRSSHRADGLLAGADAIIARLNAAPPEAATSVQQQAPTQEDSSGILLVWLLALSGVGGVGMVVALRMRASTREREAEEARRREREAALWQARAARTHDHPRVTYVAAHAPAAAAVQRRQEPARVEQASSYAPQTSSYHEDSSSRLSSYDSGGSSSSYDFGGGSSGGGGSSSDL